MENSTILTSAIILAVIIGVVVFVALGLAYTHDGGKNC